MAGYIGANTSSVTNNQNAAERRKKFTFTAATTALTGLSFLPNKIHIFHNGIRLVKDTDFTEAADGRSVTLTNAAQAGDEVVAVTFSQNPSSGGYSDTDVDAHLLTAGVTLDATNDRLGVGIAAPTAPIHIEAPDNTELMNFTVTGNEKWALKGASGVGSDDYVSFGISGGTEAIRWHEAGHVVKPNQPSFLARGNTGAWVTVSSGTQQNVAFGNVVFDLANNFSTSTNRFTAPVAGKYLFHFHCYMRLTSNDDDTNYATTRFYKNGSVYENYHNILGYNNSGDSDQIGPLTAIIDLAATDYVTAGLKANSGNAEFYQPNCNFTGYLLG